MGDDGPIVLLTTAEKGADGQIITVSGKMNTRPPDSSLPLSTVRSISAPASCLTASMRTIKATERK